MVYRWITLLEKVVIRLAHMGNLDNFVYRRLAQAYFTFLFLVSFSRPLIFSSSLYTFYFAIHSIFMAVFSYDIPTNIMYRFFAFIGLPKFRAPSDNRILHSHAKKSLAETFRDFPSLAESVFEISQETCRDCFRDFSSLTDSVFEISQESRRCCFFFLCRLAREIRSL